MKHFSTDEWIDYVRELQSPEMATKMKEHLTNCGECLASYRLWAEVSKAASNELDYAPPAHAIRITRSQFAGSQAPANDWKGIVAKLMFDSLRQPITAGARGSVSTCRQLLYQCGQRFIDLRIEKQPTKIELSLVGQIQEPAGQLSGIPVALYRGDKLMQAIETNTQGEFHMLYSPSADLYLEIDINEKRFRVQVPQVTDGWD